MTDTDQPQSHSEQTDPTKLGETVGQHDRPGDVYPPDEPLGVEDPSILDDGQIAADDVATRSEREEPEQGEESGPPPDDVDDLGERLGHDLIDPSADPDRLDDEGQLVAAEGDDPDRAAEVAAVHEIPREQLR
jgi:hypothetical protein